MRAVPWTRVHLAFLPSRHLQRCLLALVGTAVGSCLVTEDSKLNLGVVQISPQVGANGSLSLVYVNGDKCKNQRFSTRINLECAHTTVRVRATSFPPPPDSRPCI